MENEKRTPEQLEMAQYENAVRIFGEQDRMLMAAEKLSVLAGRLAWLARRDEKMWKAKDAWERDFLLGPVQLARAEVSVALAQIDVILPDCSEEELGAINRLTATYLREAERQGVSV